MALVTTVTADVQWIDPVSGLGRVVDDATAAVYDVNGTLVATKTATDLTTTSDPDAGVTYALVGFSIIGLPGTFIDVTWTASVDGVALTPYTKRYYFRPLGAVLGGATLLRWQQPDSLQPIFYEVSETDADGEVIRVIGNTIYPTFLDTTAYANEVEAQLVGYTVTPYVASDSEATDGSNQVSNTVIDGSRLVKRRVSGDYCLVTGQITDAAGIGADYGQIRFQVFPRDLPAVSQGRHLTADEIGVDLTVDGQFGVYLLQGALVAVHHAQSGLHARFAVPAQTDARLADIEQTPVVLRSAR